jgi:hypothetical protein
MAEETAPAQFVRYGPELDTLSAHFDENLETVPTRSNSTSPARLRARAWDAPYGSLMRRGMALYPPR